MLTLFRPTVLATALAFAFGAAAVHAAPPNVNATSPSTTALGTGLDKAGMDTKVRPQDDLWHAMNGGWQQAHPIPADKARIGGFMDLYDLSNERVNGIVKALTSTPQAPGSVDQKIADYYNAYMDTAALDAAGLKPVQPLLAEVDALKTTHDIAALIGRWQGRVTTPLALQAGQDPKKPEIYAPFVSQSGLGLPNRDFFVKDTEAFKKDRAAYMQYLTTLFTLSGDKSAAAHADAVMALETRMAKAQWTSEDDRDADKTYNPRSLKTLAKDAPNIDWAVLVKTGEMPVPGDLIVGEPSYLVELSSMLKSVPVATWKLYFKARVLDDSARRLPAAYREAVFQFRDHTLAGLEVDRPRWQRATDSLNAAMGEALGQVYVQKYFPPEAKARMQVLVGNLLKAYSQSIDGLSWMSPATKVAAHDKLSKYGIKIGYPDKFRDYSKLDVRAGDAVGNAQRAGRFEYIRQAVRVGQKVDRTEWGMTPQTVNAYYDAGMNEIVFPAAILQPPFFDMAADDATNYGAIGAVIGHEISHGFDDQGSKFDGDGRLRNWWTDEDRKAFEAITAKLVAQYSSYEPVPGAKLSGQLTLGENIADLSGVQIAYKAWKLALNGQPAPVIDGLSGDQRFFLGFAQEWRESRREALQRDFLTRDPHSPPQFRANGAAVNADAYHEAFGTKPGDAMWKAPADRIRLW